jgi:Protein of unknown function (DUF3177)
MPIELLRSLVWLDYRLAVLLTVFIPLTLTVWAFFKKADAIIHLLMIYWRVASLLAITVYLMIAEIRIAFFTSSFALILIPAALWFWVDLNEEITDRRDSLKLGFSAWRWAVTVFCLLGLALQLPYINCGFSGDIFKAANCQVWLDAPRLFQQTFHGGLKPANLGFYASGALMLYTFYFGYFLLLKFPKQGRSATGI